VVKEVCSFWLMGLKIPSSMDGIADPDQQASREELLDYDILNDRLFRFLSR